MTEYKEREMKSILGFGTEEKPAEIKAEAAPTITGEPVRSLVSVRFIGDGRTLTYYDDRFALEEGDRVFVSGRLAGKPGVVEKVTTRFRIRLSDYERVISKACGCIRGSYESVIGKMLSFDEEALSPADFRSWFMPPAEAEGGEGPEEEILAGDGFELSLPDLEEDEDAGEAVLDRAVDYCRNGKVAYIGVRNGIGTAYVEGSSWYEVNFRIRGDSMTEMYCGCPYPGLCKHLLAVAMTIRALARYGDVDTDRDFTAVDNRYFWPMLAGTAKRIKL